MNNSNKNVKSNLKKNFINSQKILNSNLSPKDETKKQIKIVKISKERRNAIFSSSEIGKEINKEFVFNFLSKIPGLRPFKDLRPIAEYLSQNYNYFKKIKNEQGINFLEKITRISRLETFQKGAIIIKFGEIGEKFYIVLEGTVEIFKPQFIEKVETPNNFLKELKKIRDIERDEAKYKRIKNRNLNFFKNLPDEINKNNSFHKGFDRMEYKQIFNMEIDEKMGEYREDFSFGEIALIKEAPRNATIKAKDNCILLSISNGEYNKVILDFQKRKLIQKIDYFVKTYSFFRNFDNDKVIRLFNCFTKIELYRGDYLFKQNMDANSIYVLDSGSFVVYSYISFPWINDYINYMDYSDKNILKFLIDNRNIKIDDLMKFLQEFQEKNKSKNKEIEKFETLYKINDNQTHDNLYIIKRDEEKLNTSEYIFQLNLKKIDYKDIIGLEEAFEFKKRLCNYKCISEKAELKEIKIIDLMRLILSMSRKEISDLLDIIQERKKLLKSQIIKSLENLDKKLIVNFDLRYENLVKSKENENDEDKLLSSLKVKGYKTSIQDILDKRVTLFPHEENPTPRDILKKIKTKNKSSEELLNNFLKQKQNINDFKFNKKMINIRIVKNDFQNKDFLYNISNNYHRNITPNDISTSKTFDFLSPQNSNRFRRNKLTPLNNKTNYYFKYFKNETKNVISTNLLDKNEKQNSKENIDNKNKAKRKIIPILKNYNLKRTQIFPEITNKMNKTEREKNSKLIINKEKDYKEFFHIFNRLDKNFFKGENFMKKFKIINST